MIKTLISEHFILLCVCYLSGEGKAVEHYKESKFRDCRRCFYCGIMLLLSMTSSRNHTSKYQQMYNDCSLCIQQYLGKSLLSTYSQFLLVLLNDSKVVNINCHRHQKATILQFLLLFWPPVKCCIKAVASHFKRDVKQSSEESHKDDKGFRK